MLMRVEKLQTPIPTSKTFTFSAVLDVDYIKGGVDDYGI
jgi:hypothetical protein